MSSTSGHPQFGAAREVRDRLPAVRNHGRHGPVGIQSLRREPALVQPEHRDEVAARGVPRQKDQFRIAAVGGDMPHDPCHGGRGVFETAGHRGLRREAVLHPRDGEPSGEQLLGNLAAAARQTAAVKPDDRRKALRSGGADQIEPAHRIVAERIPRLPVRHVAHRAALLRLRDAEERQKQGRNPASQQSFHPLPNYYRKPAAHGVVRIPRPLLRPGRYKDTKLNPERCGKRTNESGEIPFQAAKCSVRPGDRRGKASGHVNIGLPKPRGGQFSRA